MATNHEVGSSNLSSRDL